MAQPYLHVVSMLFRVYLFFVLLGQTVHILNGSERRYINLRHLLIKWIFLFITFMLSDHIKKHTSHDELFVLMCNLFALSMVYPSKVNLNLTSSLKICISNIFLSASGKEMMRRVTTSLNWKCPLLLEYCHHSLFFSSIPADLSSLSSILSTEKRSKRPWEEWTWW